ncbi:hypothetical protein CFC21_077125 [Triticum aestivum]|uniref:KIB1-4 beta-propeller domain-containing protein n=3 Tax=Triticinae TaxID=1648030 RepID=A0A453KGY4_AEGTS|nr:hypothetical protein CFC21_077125 [Triticum aestivum]
MSMRLSIFDLQQHPPKRLRLISLYTPLRTRYPSRLPGPGDPGGMRQPAVARHGVSWTRTPQPRDPCRGAPPGLGRRPPQHPGEKVTDLGDCSLFLGRGDGLALSAKDFPAIRRNCVYFVKHDTRKHEQWVIVFDLESNALDRIPHPQEHMEGGSKNSGWLGYSWFCPRRSFVEAL